MEEVTHVEALNLRHLRAWITVVDEGAITAGARKLGVSQPALSQQLQALEDFFGGKLLERFSRGVQPTPFGRALLNDARSTLAMASKLTQRARSAIGLEHGLLELATLPTLVEAIMLEPIRRWQALHRDVAIRIKEFTLQSKMIESVAMGEGDMAIGVTPPRWTGQITELGWERFVVVLPPDDPFAKSSEPVDLHSLADRNWVLYDPSNGLSDYVAAACAVAGFRPRMAVLTSQVHVAINLATAGLGVALVPSMNVPKDLLSMTRELREPVAWQLVAFCRTEFSAPAAEFVRLLQELTWPTAPANATVLPGN